MIEAKWKLIWDYTIPENAPPLFFQSDWNQTLITKVNQISARIYQSSLRGGANALKLHPKVFELIKDYEYYNSETKMMGGRYTIIVDDTLPEDKLYVYRNDYPMEPSIWEHSTPIIVTIHSHSPQLKEYEGRQDIELKIITPDVLIGEITILNYE